MSKETDDAKDREDLDEAQDRQDVSRKRAEDSITEADRLDILRDGVLPSGKIRNDVPSNPDVPIPENR